MPSVVESNSTSSEIQAEPAAKNRASISEVDVKGFTGHGTTDTEMRGIKDGEDNLEILDSGCVFIAGGGPVGMTVATVLAFYGIRSIVLERNKTTTK
jgi:hypothetical protein